MSLRFFQVASTIALVAIGLYAGATHDKLGSLIAVGVLYLLAIPWVGRLDKYTIGGGDLKLETSPRIGQWIVALVGFGCLAWAALTWARG